MARSSAKPTRALLGSLPESGLPGEISFELPAPGDPQAPTFAEVSGDDRNDFTCSFALFGPPGLDDALFRSLADATQTACARPAAVAAAGVAGLPLACREAEVVEQTPERDLQMARRACSDGP